MDYFPLRRYKQDGLSPLKKIQTRWIISLYEDTNKIYYLPLRRYKQVGLFHFKKIQTRWIISP
jgi:hypothetical protein